MQLLLIWVPVGTSVVLGILYLSWGEARPPFKILGTVVFLAAVYLQFFSRHATFGLVLQVAVALSLVLWRKLDSPHPR